MEKQSNKAVNTVHDNTHMEQNELEQILHKMNSFYLEILTSEGDTMIMHKEFDELIETLYHKGYTIFSYHDEYAMTLYQDYVKAIDDKLDAVKDELYERAHTLRIEELLLKECLSDIVYFSVISDMIIKFIVAF
jgi:phosphosulfolactate synthase (CoM biosynthesis protein A)